MTWLRAPRDGDLAMVTERRRRGQFDRVPVLAQYSVLDHEEPEVGWWRYFGSDGADYPSDVDIHYYVTTTRLVGYAAL